NDRGHNRRLAAVGADLTDKRLVDFEGVERKLSQIAQARITRPEIGDRPLHPSFPQGLQDGCRGFGMLHQQGLGQFELEKSRVETGFVEYREQISQKVYVAKLHRGDVYRY